MRILILTHPGTNSRGLLLDIAAGLEELGHEVLRLDLGPTWRLKSSLKDREGEITEAFGHQVREFVAANGIEFSIGMWANGTLSLPIVQRDDGRLSSFWDAIGCPHLHYWWDAPHWFNNGGILPFLRTGLFNGPCQLHAINNRFTAAEMAEIMGFSNVLAQPNGVNPRVFHPCTDVRPEYDLVFLSGGGDPPPTTVMLEELEKDAPDVERIRRDCAARLAPQFERLASSYPEPVRARIRRLLDVLLERRLAERHTPALLHVQQAVHAHRDLAEAAVALINDPPRYVEATAAVRSIETWERPFVVAYLSRHFKCLRMGAQSYDAWGIRGDHVETVPYDWQSQVYARARFALNVMRWQDDCSLNSKVFEITAARCGCLQACRGGIEELFEDGREILVFRTPADARERLAEALRTPGRAEAIAEAGHRRTLAEHTWAHRMKAVVDVVGQMRSARPGATANDSAMPGIISRSAPQQGVLPAPTTERARPEPRPSPAISLLST